LSLGLSLRFEFGFMFRVFGHITRTLC